MTKTRDLIKGAWAVIVENTDAVVREMSVDRFGHPVGNLTPADISHHLVYQCGMDRLAAAALAKGAYNRHELWRWSDEGIVALEEFNTPVDVDTPDANSTDKE
jgi:hypothetical protein